MKTYARLAQIVFFLFFAQAAHAASISYSFFLEASYTLDGAASTESAPMFITGVGDTDDIFNIDTTRIANAFDATINIMGVSYSFTETVYVARAGGTLAFAADISGLSIGSVVSANTVPTSFGLDTDADFFLDPALTFGSFETDGGVLSIDGFAPDTSVIFSSRLIDTPPATVPLPAASLLLLSTIGGLGAMARRRKA